MFYLEFLQPGFTSCTPEELTNNFGGEKPSEFRMGAISTAWHKVEVDAMTKFDHISQVLSQETQGKINAVERYSIRKRGLTCNQVVFSCFVFGDPFQCYCFFEATSQSSSRIHSTVPFHLHKLNKQERVDLCRSAHISNGLWHVKGDAKKNALRS